MNIPEGPYTKEAAQDMTRLLKYRPDGAVEHQRTCPVCGRKLVNIYKRSGTWKCRACWEEAAP